MNKEVKAKLLKEKGFDEWTKTWYQRGDGVVGYVEGKRDFYNRKGDVYTSAPTIAEVVTWLYEKHGIWIFPDYGKKTNSWYYNIQTLAISNHPERILWESGYSSPTEAYEDAIEYTLKNLI